MNIAERSRSESGGCCPTCGTETSNPSLATACTLAPEGLEGRIAEIRGLARRALLRSERNDLVLSLTYRPSAKDDVDDLIARETECCGFLTFQVEEEDDCLLVTVTAARHAETVALELFDAFEGRTSEAAR